MAFVVKMSDKEVYWAQNIGHRLIKSVDFSIPGVVEQHLDFNDDGSYKGWTYYPRENHGGGLFFEDSKLDEEYKKIWEELQKDSKSFRAELKVPKSE